MTPDTPVINQGYTVTRQGVSSPCLYHNEEPQPRASSSERYAAMYVSVFSVALHGLVASITGNSPNLNVQFAMHSSSAVTAEEDRQCQHVSAIAHVHTLLMLPQYLETWRIS
jgi:hypothetical protein